ncbi:YbjN domain-containing protein [Novispirillum sp. DQ9]|uniref:YbjN domain-containing protein n=1 Tax=Novispirillum sp. DQ9 TaxID=3398612 RepID=UPI003C7E57FB
MSLRTFLHAAVAVAFLLGLSAGAGAARAETATVLTTLTAKKAEAMFRDLGYTSIEVDKDNDLVVTIQGMKVLVLVGSTGGSSMQMRFAVADTKATMARVNTWNKTKMYSRAYLDDDGDPVLEAEQDLVGGVTEERLKDFIKTFGVSLSAFLNEVT